MKKRNLPAFFILLLILITGCSRQPSYKIGISQCSADDWRAKLNDEFNREAMFRGNVDIEIRSANDNSEKQIEDIRYFAENGFDLLIVSPNVAEPLTPVIKEVYESGMPVIIFDRSINGKYYTARIKADDNALGEAAARYALHLKGPGANAIELYGLPGSTPAEGRHNGFNEIFTENGGNVLACVPADWDSDKAAKAADTLLKKYPDIDIIFAHNDRMAIAASEVASKAGRRDNIKIIGIDAAPEIGIRAIADSVIDATFLYPTAGDRILSTALNILEHKPYDTETILPSSSAVDLSNADILLLQNQSLKNETSKFLVLKSRFDEYWDKHKLQSGLLYTSIAIIVLLFVTVFLILRTFRQHHRHQKVLLRKNGILENQRNILEQQRNELEQQRNELSSQRDELANQRDELANQRDQLQDLNEKLHMATQSKINFFTNVSHDLRTPLTLIAEPVAYLENASNLNPRQQRLTRIALKNIKILQRLINQILDFRMHENDKIDLHLKEIDLGHAIEEWMENFVGLAAKRNISFTLASPHAKEAVLAVDSEKIERVFFNLVSNAFKFTPAGGKISVEYHLEDNEFIFSVSDTGKGMSGSELGKIFDKFYRIDSLNSKGSGIGLFLSKAFVEQHGGTITVESTPDVGTTFTVKIPVTHVADAPEKTEPIIHKEDIEAELETIDGDIIVDETKPLILVIDDNPDIRRLITELLNDEYNVITAADARKGIHRAAKYLPDLIICDVMMPGTDGLECCRILKSEQATAHIPVLMLTACALDEQRVEGYANGADGYMPKPFRCEVLKARCASLINNRNLVRNSIDRTPGKSGKTVRNIPVSDIDSDFYNRFINLLEADIGNSELTVDMLASKIGLERSQFYCKIKAITGATPVDVIKRIRLKRGRHLLTTTEMSIAEVAYAVGFANPAYFSLCYRQMFGETASQTRSRL